MNRLISPVRAAPGTTPLDPTIFYLRQRVAEIDTAIAFLEANRPAQLSFGMIEGGKADAA